MKARFPSAKGPRSRFGEFRDKHVDPKPGEPSEEAIVPRVLAEIAGQQLIANFRTIAALVPGRELIPMLKADAYGHGAAWAAKLLCLQPGLQGLGVATLEEGRQVRKELGDRRSARITIFSGTALWSDAKGEFCERFGLSPVIASEDDWHRFLKAGWPARLSYELKFNTGMNRLGMEPGFASQIIRALRTRPALEQPVSVFSHLACAEDPTSRLTQKQVAAFAAVRGEFASAMPSVRFHLANSAAIWNAKHYGIVEMTDAVRPGLALYGIPPYPKAPARGISPVMTLKASILQTRWLKPGDRLGYGGEFQVGSSDPKRHVGILGMGYADGLNRSLGSGRGFAWVNGRESRFLGRVSMDLSAVDIAPETRAGEWAEIMGPHVDAWAQAAAAGTIPYELLTSVSPRVQKKYV